MEKSVFEYIWLDGYDPPNIRSKIVVDTEIKETYFDGSSTRQADVRNSDLLLVPVAQYDNPFSLQIDSKIVLCEVFDGEKPHPSNWRYKLRNLLPAKDGILVGIEQEYVMMQQGWPLGWEPAAYPEPQGRYYCGNGAKYVKGRQIAMAHLKACLRAGVNIAGYHPEVMLSQWEYQIRADNPLKVADDLIVSRFLLERVAELYDVEISYHPKPVEGWNGSGCHIHISTDTTRNIEESYMSLAEHLLKTNSFLLKHYGNENEKRLQGKCEAPSIDNPTIGISDRTATIRIPRDTAEKRVGRIEDRRPGANIDPYRALYYILEVIP